MYKEIANRNDERKQERSSGRDYISSFTGNASASSSWIDDSSINSASASSACSSTAASCSSAESPEPQYILSNIYEHEKRRDSHQQIACRLLVPLLPHLVALQNSRGTTNVQPATAICIIATYRTGGRPHRLHCQLFQLRGRSCPRLLSHFLHWRLLRLQRDCVKQRAFTTSL